MNSHVFAIEDLVKEAKRELSLRKRVYPGWCASGKLNRSQADRQIALQEAIVAELEKSLPVQPVQGSLL